MNSYVNSPMQLLSAQRYSSTVVYRPIHTLQAADKTHDDVTFDNVKRC